MRRPGKGNAAPLPLYASEPTSYCHTCGRVVSSNKKKKSTPTGKLESVAAALPAAKFCSTRCRNNRPGGLGRLIESVFAAVLDLDVSRAILSGRMREQLGIDGDESRKRLIELIDAKRSMAAASKGDKRVKVFCSEALHVLFPDDTAASEPVASRPRVSSWEGHSDENDDDNDNDNCELSDDGLKDSQLQEPIEILRNVDRDRGGDQTGTARTTSTTKQQQGMQRAARKEMVKQAARRLVVFGWRRSSSDSDSDRSLSSPSSSSSLFCSSQFYDAAQSRDSDAGVKNDNNNNDDDDDGSSHQNYRQISAVRFCDALLVHIDRHGSRGRARGQGVTVVEPSFARGDWSIRWRS